VTFELPEDLAHHFGQDACALSRTAVEAPALEGVRSGKLSAAQAGRLLGFRTRYQMDTFLKAHGIGLQVTIEQVRRDGETALTFSR
jgi:hypothetical protein